ncbi:replication initiator protein A [Staphylococcus aureus]|uniref:replication initiator protein A n=1 Tax=Staphylococcus aureus TaxID=1280 RepID=UPI000DA512CF|nr:replication initiator protein A [Staphylococcus aureus]SRF58133.1 replication initiator A domain-containing protein [Staphylococcus aureus]
MSNFKKISASEFETLRFYQLPKFLFEDEYFSKMPTDAKVMYAILKDRFELSRLNNWVDSENNIYLLYTNKQLCSILNYAEPKIIKLKKELEKYNLIMNERQGLNKPNKIYLLEPTYDKELINSKFQNKEIISSGTNDSSVQELTNSKSNDTDLNNTNYIETENNDMDDLNDITNKNEINNHSNHPNQFSNNLDDKDYKEILLQEFPNQLTNYLLNYDYRDLEIIKAIILKAKKSFNSNHEDAYYMLEHIEDEILIALKRFKKAIYDRGVKGQKETIHSMQGYLMQTILTELEELYSADMRRKNMSGNNIFNM